MKLPETKLNIGDSIWIMKDNSPKEYIVYEITVRTYGSGETKISYYSRIAEIHGEYYHGFNECEIGRNVFLSKKDLFLNQFGDCLEEGLIVK